MRANDAAISDRPVGSGLPMTIGVTPVEVVSAATRAPPPGVVVAGLSGNVESRPVAMKAVPLQMA